MMRIAPPRRAIALLGVTCALLVAAALAWLLFGPVYTTGGAQCSSGSGCTTVATATVPLGWRPILAVPLAGGVLLLLSALISRWPEAAVVTNGLGCLALGVITALGVASIGLLFVPADVAAAAALVLLIRATAR